MCTKRNKTPVSFDGVPSKRNFVCYVEWGYSFDPEGQANDYSHCYIGYARTEDYAHDGDNYVAHGGAEGLEFDIIQGLENALIHSQYKPAHISFGKLNKHDRAELDYLLNVKYDWRQDKGFFLRSTGERVTYSSISKTLETVGKGDNE